MEARIYHSICIVAFFALAYNVPFNYFVGLPKAALICLIALSGFAWLYYVSRVKKKFTYSVLGLGLFGNVFFTAIYFINSGVNGPTLILFALFFYLLSATAPKHQQWIWLLVNIVVVTSLCVIQYIIPSWVPSSYENELSRYTDTISAYMVVIISIFYSLRYIRINYETEKKSAIDKALDIELKNIQLELVNGEKNKLFSIVAHDLRSPLASIQSYLELLTAFPLKEEEKKEIELKLLSLTKNTSNMMANLLSWSKSQLEGVQVNTQTLNLMKTLRDMLKVETSIAHEKEIILTYHIDENIYVQADANMLMLVIRNLINNAIKFTPEGGNIQIMVVVDDDCRITVTDSGKGIAESDQKHVFSLKAKSTFGTNNEKGVGLGLILCKEFIELQKGSIEFRSTQGRGTSFTVSIPVTKLNIDSSSQQSEWSDIME
ncbi:sensor histidine kinase KdpD [Pedobacter sp. L105]|uniref:sensor histidine kinase n=1 Tax=Pedobacter sp. L105 TaxID=1641871 RepID=UPI0020B1096C|nr:HAMP domain-containing sensor histidine kinase [Pedobacter sp. L105]